MADTPTAARIEDPLYHTNALLGALEGLAIGLAVGVFAAMLVIGSIATGGALLVVVAAYCTAISLVCTGASLGFGFGEFLGSLSGSIAGVIAHGSTDTFIGGEELQAARVEAEVACMQHGEEPKVATGAKNVYINSKNAARVGDKTTCDAEIKSGCPTVGIGGESVRVLAIEPEVPEWLETGMEWVDRAGVVFGFLGSLGAKELVKEVTLAGIDVTLLFAEHHLGDAYGRDSWQYQTAVWTRRAYETALLGRGIRNGLRERALDQPSHILGPNGERINMRGEPIPPPGPRPAILDANGNPIRGGAPPNPDAHIIDPRAPTPQPNARIIDPRAPTPQPNARIIDPRAPTPQPNARIILPPGSG